MHLRSPWAIALVALVAFVASCGGAPQMTVSSKMVNGQQFTKTYPWARCGGPVEAFCTKAYDRLVFWHDHQDFISPATWGGTMPPDAEQQEVLAHADGLEALTNAEKALGTYAPGRDEPNLTAEQKQWAGDVYYDWSLYEEVTYPGCDELVGYAQQAVHYDPSPRNRERLSDVNTICTK